MVQYVVTCQECGTDVPESEATITRKGTDIEIEFDCPNPDCQHFNSFCE